MEKLEKILEQFNPIKEEKSLVVEKPLYEGLKKIEDKAYKGPTGKKYWM